MKSGATGGLGGHGAPWVVVDRPRDACHRRCRPAPVPAPVPGPAGPAPRTAGAARLHNASDICTVAPAGGRTGRNVARTQEERKAETRARLLAAAADLFADQGIDAVSVDAVAEAAGRTSGAVYAHFGSKQGLLLALLDSWKDSVLTVLLAEVAVERLPRRAAGRGVGQRVRRPPDERLVPVAAARARAVAAGGPRPRGGRRRPGRATPRRCATAPAASTDGPVRWGPPPPRPPRAGRPGQGPADRSGHAEATRSRGRARRPRPPGAGRPGGAAHRRRRDRPAAGDRHRPTTAHDPNTHPPPRRPPMHTEICDRLGIEFPIFAFTHCRDVVAAVTNAGGIGVLGADRLHPRAARGGAHLDRRARRRQALRRRHRHPGQVRGDGRDGPRQARGPDPRAWSPPSTRTSPSRSWPTTGCPRSPRTSARPTG